MSCSPFACSKSYKWLLYSSSVREASIPLKHTQIQDSDFIMMTSLQECLQTGRLYPENIKSRFGVAVYLTLRACIKEYDYALSRVRRIGIFNALNHFFGRVKNRSISKRFVWVDGSLRNPQSQGLRHERCNLFVVTFKSSRRPIKCTSIANIMIEHISACGDAA